jgi:hypothetical protein
LNGLRDLLPGGPLCNTIGLICDWVETNDRFELLRWICEKILSSQQSNHTLTGISYAIMDLHDYLDVGCDTDGDSLEVFFDAASPKLTLFIETLFQRVTQRESGALTRQRLAFAGYVSLRFMTQSPGLIAMQKFPRTCAIEIAGCNAVHGTKPFLARIEQDAVEMDGAVHWGQHNEIDMAAVEKMFDPCLPKDALR